MMPVGRSSAAGLLLAILATAATGSVAPGCAQSAPPLDAFTVILSATSDEGLPMPGVAAEASLSIDQRSIPIGTTEEDGRLTAEVKTIAGSQIEIRAQCPEGYRISETVIRLTLRPIFAVGGAGPAPHRAAISCIRTDRLVVAIVRADGHEGLPILMDDKPVANTGKEGIAQFLIRIPAHSSFGLVLDTSSMPDLRPQNPSATFKVAESDEIFVFDQPFEKKAKPRAKKHVEETAVELAN